MGDINSYCSNCEQLRDLLDKTTVENRQSLKTIREMSTRIDRMSIQASLLQQGKDILQQDKEWLVTAIEEMGDPNKVELESMLQHREKEETFSQTGERVFPEVVEKLDVVVANALSGMASVIKKLMSGHRSERACDRISDDEKKLIDMLSQL